MTDNCETVRSLLGLGQPLPATDAEHAANCNDCSALTAQMADLDALMASEPTPLAPPDLAPAIMAALRELRLAELKQFRIQLLVPLAAAVIIALVATFGLDTPETQAWTPDPTPAYTYGQSFLDGLRTELEAAFDAAFTTAPESPPLLLIGLLFPAILIINWSLARGRPHSATRPT